MFLPFGLAGLAALAQQLVPLGVDPFDQDGMADVVRTAMKMPGVKVILARQECAIQAQRLGKQSGPVVKVVEENCNLCKLCLMATGCSAISLGMEAVEIDPELCYGCGICVDSCHREALIQEAA